ncbi:uncharacterized protein ARMOST_10210 [Armillaria ostoyae]|uniref:Integrase catalytic domain-containing protein n=1 Tax=Armillaria ostoyae TaxID=47428 RepID=A0A284RDR7_ARMOS|nr:uncharacterized protein ARMOST_10210 [Armillaria ostoyae]
MAPPIPPRPNRPPLPQPPAPPAPHAPSPPPNISAPPPPFPPPPPPPNNPNTAPPPYPYVQPNALAQQYHNIQLQIQYIYLSTPTNTLENNIPQTSHILELKTQADWAAWYHGVQNLLTSRALFTHICDPPALHIARDPMNTPSFPPVLHPYPLPQHTQEWISWHCKDAVVYGVLTSRLSRDILSMIPPLMDPGTGARSTVREAFHLLRRRYGGGNIQYALLEHKHLALVHCTSINNIPQFIQLWTSLTQTLHDMEAYPLSYTTLSLDVINLLPPHCSEICNKVVGDLRNPNAFNQESFNTLLTDIIDQANGLLMQCDLSKLSRNPKTSLKPHERVVCVNPKCPYPTGHTTANCWHEGGSDPGGKEKYQERQKAKQTARANLIVNPTVPVLDEDPYPPDPYNTNECTEQADLNDDVYYLYIPGSPESVFAMANTLLDLEKSDPKSYHLAMQAFKALLNSGTTHHIINDHTLFQSYDESKAIPIETTNCSILNTFAMGEVHFCKKLSGRTATVILHECLYAPDTPINLISVRAMTENGMYVGFGKNKTTCYFPRNHKMLSGLSFQADVIGRLSFLDCEFIKAATPNGKAKATAFVMLPTFQKPEYDVYLWHCRTRHPSQDTTRCLVSGNACVKGVQWNGKSPHELCPSCIMGKQAQKPYDHNTNCATKVLELLHIDTCGPMPILTPKKQQHFFAILDNHTSYNEAEPIVKKNDCTHVFKDTQALWENQMNEKVKKVHCDGAKEFTQGELGQHFKDSGIEVQMTALYAHQQNGKAERFIQTLEDDAQTLIADSGLPMSFWGDAVMTASYTRKRIPVTGINLKLPSQYESE